MKKKIFVMAAMIICSRLQSQIEDTTGKLMDEVIFTANKYPNKTSLTGKVLTIITRQQLERSGGRNLSQVLNEQAGLNINGANSNPGKDKSVFLRGARSEHTLITIDGVPVYDPSGIGSNFDIRNMAIDNIERIEILKGSQSTLYGSDAIAGVINIITRKPDTKSFSSSSVFSYGSYQTFRGNTVIRGNSNIINYNASYTYFRTRGIDEAVNKNNLPGTDKDGLEQNNIQAGIDLQPNKNISIQTYIRFGKLNGEIDQGAFIDELDYTYTQKSYQAGIRNEFIIRKAKLNVLYNYNHIDRLYIDDSVKSRNGFDIYSRGSYKGAEHFSDVYLTIPAGNNSKITAGADFRGSRSDQEYFSEGFFGPFTSMYANDSLKQNQAGVYAAININARSGFNIELGNRINIHSVYGANYVFNVNPSSYLLNKKVKLFANLSNAYRTPSLYQLFSEYGNKNLRPESAFTAEAGAQYFFPNNKITARTVFFNRDVKDIIFFYFNPVTFRSQYINQDRQNDHGGEFEFTVIAARNTMLKIFYSYVNGKITTRQNGKDTVFFNLLRRPKHSMGINVSSQVTDRFNIGANLLVSGKRKDAYFDAQSFQIVNVMLDSYMLLDIYSEYNLYSRIKLFIDFRNLTNSKFTEVSGFNTVGFNVFGGLRLNL